MDPLGSDADDGLVDGKVGKGRFLHAFGFWAGADDHYLHGIEQQTLEGQSIGAGVEAEVLHNAGKGGERLLGDVAILLAAG